MEIGAAAAAAIEEEGVFSSSFISTISILIFLIWEIGFLGFACQEVLLVSLK